MVYFKKEISISKKSAGTSNLEVKYSPPEKNLYISKTLEITVK
jgi:hypothetical protein